MKHISLFCLGIMSVVLMSHGAYKFTQVTNETTGASATSVLVPDGSPIVTQSQIGPLIFAEYYPNGSVNSVSELTAGIKYTFTSNATGRTASVKPFCNTGAAADDNSDLVGRVVIPPFVDAQGNPYLTDDGTRYKVVGVSDAEPYDNNLNLTAIVAPNTVTTIGVRAFLLCYALTSVSLPTATTIGDYAFDECYALTSVSLPAATTIGEGAFLLCYALTSVSLPAATTIGDYAFDECYALTSVSLPAATTIGEGAFLMCYALTSVSLPAATTIGDDAFGECYALTSVSLPAATTIGDRVFYYCEALAVVDFGATLSSVPTLGVGEFYNVPTTCKMIVPNALYDRWIAASGWEDLYNNGNGYKFLRHSEWEYARRYEIAEATPANYNAVSNAAMNAVQEESLGNSIEDWLGDGGIDYWYWWLKRVTAEEDFVHDGVNVFNGPVVFSNQVNFTFSYPLDIDNIDLITDENYSFYFGRNGRYRTWYLYGALEMSGPVTVKQTGYDDIWNLVEVQQLLLPPNVFVGGYDHTLNLLEVATTNYVSDLMSGALPNDATLAENANFSNAVLAVGQNIDTSYRRFEGVTNINQTVQYVTTGQEVTALNIEIPSKGDTKDWIVYVVAMRDLTLHLPSGTTWWVADRSYTNSIPANQPTALYFSQVTDGVYTMGRQYLEPIEAP